MPPELRNNRLAPPHDERTVRTHDLRNSPGIRRHDWQAHCSGLEGYHWRRILPDGRYDSYISGPVEFREVRVVDVPRECDSIFQTFRAFLQPLHVGVLVAAL